VISAFWYSPKATSRRTNWKEELSRPSDKELGPVAVIETANFVSMLPRPAAAKIIAPGLQGGGHGQGLGGRVGPSRRGSVEDARDAWGPMMKEPLSLT